MSAFEMCVVIYKSFKKHPVCIKLDVVLCGSGQDRLSTPCVHRYVKQPKGRPPYKLSLPGSHHCHFLISQNAPGPAWTWPQGPVAVQSCSQVAV